MNKFIVGLAVIVLLVTGGFFVFNDKRQTEEINRNNKSNNTKSNLSNVIECNIATTPERAKWEIGNNEVEIKWQSQNADTAYLYFMSGGVGGDIVAITMRQGKNVSLDGSEKVSLNLTPPDIGYPYYYSLVVKNNNELAWCNTEGQKLMRTLEEQEKIENTPMG